MESYGRHLVVDVPFEAALAETVDAFHAEGLDPICRVDVRNFLARTLQHDFRNYVLFHVAAPQATLDALQEDLSAGTILPVAVAVFELADGETAVVVTEPFAAVLADPGWRASAPRLLALADRVCAQVARALDRLQHATVRTAMPALEQFT